MILLRQIFVGYALFFVLVSGQVFRQGPCPDVKFVRPVDWYRMQGQWFLLERFPEYHPVLYYQRCISEIKSLHRNGTLSVFASNLNTKTGEYTKDLFVTLIKPDSYEPSIATSDGILDSLPDYTYYLLDLNYDSWHLVYACVDAGPDKKWSLEYVGILSRSPRHLTRSLQKKLYRRLKRNNINPDFLQPVDQRYCPKDPI